MSHPLTVTDQSEVSEPAMNKLLCVTLTQPSSHSAPHNHEKLGGGCNTHQMLELVLD